MCRNKQAKKKPELFWKGTAIFTRLSKNIITHNNDSQKPCYPFSILLPSKCYLFYPFVFLNIVTIGFVLYLLIAIIIWIYLASAAFKYVLSALLILHIPYQLPTNMENIGDSLPTFVSALRAISMTFISHVRSLSPGDLQRRPEPYCTRPDSNTDGITDSDLFSSTLHCLSKLISSRDFQHEFNNVRPLRGRKVMLKMGKYLTQVTKQV